MESLSNIYKNLIIESILSNGQLSILEDAIKNVYKLRMNYYSPDLGDTKGYFKEIIPIRWGYHKKTGNPMVRAFEQLGAVSGRNLHKEKSEGKQRFKLYRFDRILSIKPSAGKVTRDPEALRNFTEDDKELNIKLNVDLNTIKEKIG